jgi:regulatory protein YycH of two-component signal transduction system YycFG
MMEKMKSVTLIILVIISLVQSYFLAYSSPKFDNVVQTDYVQNEVIGTQAERGDILFPEQIILHSGHNTHTLLPLSQQFYSMIYDNFLKRKFYDGFRRYDTSSVYLNWDYIRKQNPGIELRFKEAIPLHVLQSILQIKQEAPLVDEMISRIWIYTVDNTDEVHTFFLTNKSSVVYEATKVDISADNVKKFVAFGQYRTTYHSVTGDYYLPDDSLTMTRIQASYSEFTADQLKRNLFVDPSMTRYFVERDLTQIYTDGKRALQLKNVTHWMKYSDPISTPVDNSNDAKENLLSSIQFINEHGGWNGTYIYSRMSSDLDTGSQTFLFRQYVDNSVDNYPLIGLSPNNFGYIKLVLQRGVVSVYERSLINIDNNSIEKKEAFLPGGKTLDNMIDNYAKKLEIVSVFPAYQVIVIRGKKVDLVPRWAVELKDGTNEFIY